MENLIKAALLMLAFIAVITVLQRNSRRPGRRASKEQQYPLDSQATYLPLVNGYIGSETCISDGHDCTQVPPAGTICADPSTGHHH